MMTRSNTAASQRESDGVMSGDMGSTGSGEPVIKNQSTTGTATNDEEINSTDLRTTNGTESTTTQMLEVLMIQNNMLI